MGSPNSRKINRLLKEWPKGTIVTKAKLDKLGIYRQLVTKYIQYGWIDRLGSGAFLRSGDSVDWQGGLFALQTQLNMTVHVGALSSLELLGQAHFVPLGRQKTTIFISDRPEQLPVWFRNHKWGVSVKHSCLSLFHEIPDKANTNLDCGGFTIVMSSAERAIMEQMRLAGGNDEIDHCYRLMEGLTTLRPTVVQELLENCRSAKVKRLFLWCAETAGHTWFKRLEPSHVDLGKGKRQVYKGGRLNRKYMITVPQIEKLPDV